MIFRRFPVKRKVVLNTKTDKTFTGVIWEKGRDYLILKNVQMLSPREKSIPLDGDVLVFTEDIEFVQLV